MDDGGRFTAEAGPALEGKDVLGDGNQVIMLSLLSLSSLCSLSLSLSLLSRSLSLSAVNVPV